jgi:hypothetical protein
MADQVGVVADAVHRRLSVSTAVFTQAFEVFSGSGGIISEANFVKTCSTLCVQKFGRQECKRIFSEIDEECKGFLKHDDFTRALKRNRILQSIAEVRLHGRRFVADLCIRIAQVWRRNSHLKAGGMWRTGLPIRSNGLMSAGA